MYCTRCGKQNPDEAAFCWGCGAELTQSHPDIGDLGSTVAEDVPSPGEAFTPGMLLDGRYRLEKLLGQGGMGRVWKARDTRLDLPVAIKFLNPVLLQNPTASQRFLSEARVCLTLTHPGIVRLHTIGEWLGQTYLVMEYLEGQTLADRLAELKGAGQRPPWPEAAAILDQLAEAIGTAHRTRVIHRDLKPSNIMLARREGGKRRVVVLDFGLAKSLGQEGLTRLGASLGTPFYMAPEQTRNGSQVDPRADIYSIGAIAYEMFTGKVPLGRIASIRQAYPALPADVESWIFGALEPEPEARKVRLEELRQRLRKAVPSLAEIQEKEREKEKQAQPKAAEKPGGGPGKPGEKKDQPKAAAQTTTTGAGAGAGKSSGTATDQTARPKPVSRGGSGRRVIWYLIVISMIAYGHCHRSKLKFHDTRIPNFPSLPTPAPDRWNAIPERKNTWEGGPTTIGPTGSAARSPGAASAMIAESARAYAQGVRYAQGDGVARDDRQAVMWYRKAAEAGNSQGMNALGLMYQNGRGVAQSDELALQWYRKAAEAGSPEGMNNLGWMYGNGRGIARDYDAAFQWYRKAAEAGSAAGMYNLGLLYETGRGTPKDLGLALSWYERAAALGQKEAVEKVERLRRAGW